MPAAPGQSSVRIPPRPVADAAPEATEHPPEPTRVRVAHGDIRFARSPVLVGHYNGDGILSAEAAIDHTLGGRLSRCARLGLYPGAVETCQVFLDHGAWAGPPGAVVLGLGEVGHLSVAQLTRAVAHAVLTLSLREDLHGGTALDEASAAAAAGFTRLSLSTLLIGSGAGGLGVAESVQGILDGVRRANDRLRTAGLCAAVGEVEILEIWQDRALLAVRALRDAVEADPLRELFHAHARLLVGRGGRRRPVFSEPPGWWQRVHIDEQDDGSLAFESPTRLAGTAVRTVATQRLLVDQLVTALVDSPTPDPAAARTLFELLIPVELKDQAPMLEDVVLVLDKSSAAYPWELLHGAWTGEQGRPAGLERGVIRQLTSDTFRSRVLAATGTAALVIGDTDSGQAPLPGAQREARAVQTALQEAGFACTALVRARGTRVVQELFARPYRVVHIAAHGVRELPLGTTGGGVGDRAATETVTGVVLGEGMYLTAAEVAQMSQAPDLVFVNCCHLGVVEERPLPHTGPSSAGPAGSLGAPRPSIPPGAPGPPGAAGAPGPVGRLGSIGLEHPAGHGAGGGRGDYHRLAASLATELIDAGVRAVVVAGWAVDDAAATTFATALYGGLLGGLAFGEAVTAARIQTWERHPEVNTWGAYQCYADPDYRLSHRRSAGADRAALPRPACVEEVEAAIDNITQSMTVARSTGRCLAALDKYCAALDGSDWLDDPRVQVRLARASDEGGRLAAAVEWFERAVREGSAALTLHDIEVGADLRVRMAVHQALAGELPGEQAAARIDAAIGTLTALVGDPGLTAPGAPDPAQLDALAEAPGAGLDRLWTLGMAYQRRAHVTATGRAAALAAMAACFRAALKVPTRPAGRPRSGVVAQLVRAELAAAWTLAGSDASGMPSPTLIDQALVEARQIAERAPTFWRCAVCVDLQVLAALISGAVDDEVVARLTGEYRRVVRSGSARELRLLDESLGFLVAMSSSVPAAAAFLGGLHAALGALQADASGASGAS